MRDREFNKIRDLKITPNYLSGPDGSCLVEMGNTKIIVTAMIEDKVPFFLKGQGVGWLSAEYSMIPGSTQRRKPRDISRGKIDGRSQEIQRLIGRSLRSAIDLTLIGERTIWIDCDVISADGGTRTLSVTGGFVALKLAVNKYLKEKLIFANPIKRKVAAISLGKVYGRLMVDLDFNDDSKADVDMNIVMDEDHNIIEIQGTSEKTPLKIKELDELVKLSEETIDEIMKIVEDTVPSNNYLVLSTDNVHKIKEMESILSDIDLIVESKSDVGLQDLQVDEDQETLEGNARKKAEEISKLVGYKNVISDDTGLFVNALNGEPGVHSARYCGDHDDKKNIEKILEKLQDKEDRSAYFQTSIALVEPNKEIKLFSGRIDGTIAYEERGEEGFGYDSVFIPNGYDKTFAELGEEEKNKISHRAIATENLKSYLKYKYRNN